MSAQAPIPPLKDVLVLDANSLNGPRFLGFVPISGDFLVQATAPFLPGGVDAELVLLQSAFVSAGGSATLGPATSVVVLDAGF